MLYKKIIQLFEMVVNKLLFPFYNFLFSTNHYNGEKWRNDFSELMKALEASREGLDFIILLSEHLIVNHKNKLFFFDKLYTICIAILAYS